jgi:hypothetical protein
MLLQVTDKGGFKNVQTIYFPECTRIFQDIDGDDIVVTYHAPEKPLIPATPEQSTALRIPCMAFLVFSFVKAILYHLVGLLPEQICLITGGGS